MVAKARENSSIIYSFDEPPNSEIRSIFNIDPHNGTITLIGSLDRETKPFYYVSPIAYLCVLEKD